jgi:signal transduction histidine kinase
VLITLQQREDEVLLEITDWGDGFDVSAVGPERFGLRGIRERTRTLRGEASIVSAPGQGTRIAMQLPLTSRERTNRDEV